MSAEEAILHHYEIANEQKRLLTGSSQIELLRTQEVLRRHLPTRPARILDVGGGAGIYAQWLAEMGHQVTLVDLSPRHVEIATSSLSPLGVQVEQGDARSLAVPDGSFDVVLLMGPLYHLQDPSDRLKAWREARRAARPGGIVAAAAISRFASLFDGLTHGYLFDSEFRQMVHRDLTTGAHLNPSRRPEWFTTAYLHHPDELIVEAQAADLTVLELVGLEGLARWLPFSEERWASPTDREIILEAARLVEHEPSLAGLSAHLLLVCQVR